MADVMKRDHDPIAGFRFQVKIQGSDWGRFQEVSGLNFEIEVKDYPQGGQNTFVNKFPGRRKYANIKLKRGYIGGDHGKKLFTWFNDFNIGQSQISLTRYNGEIIVCDRLGNRLHSWSFKDGFPVKWEGPKFNSTQDSVLVESLEIAHHGLTYNG